MFSFEKPWWIPGAALLMLALTGAAQAGELKSLMKDMKTAMNGAMGSAGDAEFSSYLQRLRLDADRAAKLPYPDNQTDYREGMRALSADLDKAEQFAKAGDLAAAKRSLQAANQTKKRYHHLLN
ncbi:cytochrome b562 [Chromobacterium sp. IIBBL 290-4]|uniref:cytochrome b562 n=1 Tax=Chromobacterium sp. IIBBL 290-4 TaxID=2953890 RepID=UPI0020B76493|nr:cytochrome b562 [Chromobacterium sp. IIBBL 290-4]UTH76640.1 cytochrome b562 [Chromobacterium sp. IIBBL 290-4]